MQSITDKITKRLRSLASREHEILILVVAGILNRHIAAKLKMSENTVKTHRARIMRKMEVKSLAELVRATEKVGMQLHQTETIEKE